MTSQQVIDFISSRLIEGQKLTTICEGLMDNCLATDAMSGLGCDNMTVVICALLGGRTEEEWRKTLVQRLASPPGAFPDDGVN
jgi:protein phosphatase PTC2/3